MSPILVQLMDVTNLDDYRIESIQASYTHIYNLFAHESAAVCVTLRAANLPFAASAFFVRNLALLLFTRRAFDPLVSS